MRTRSLQWASLLAGALALAGCLPSEHAVFGPVHAEVKRRVGIDPAAPAAIRALLAQPLDLDAAVRVGLASNARLLAAYDELGIAASEVASATVLGPMEIEASYRVATVGEGNELELSAIQDVLGLLQLPQRRGAAQAELAAARARAVAQTVALAAQIEIAFVDAVAAQQRVELRRTAMAAASGSADLIERMHAAGNTTDLALAREQEQRAQAELDLARAQLEVETARAGLTAALGLDDADAASPWTTVGQLPELPATEPALGELEDHAVAASLELEALRRDADGASGRLGEARVRAWLPSLGVGVSVARRDDADWELGPAIRVGLPIFDHQEGPRARARSEVRRAQHLGAATERELRAHAHAVRQTVAAAYAEAVRIRDVILPLRQQVLDETLKHYNAMNASTFELLTARRELVAAGEQRIDALRRFWIASAEARALDRGGMP